MINSTTGRNESCMLVRSEGHKLPENTDPTTTTTTTTTTTIIIIIIIIIHSAYNIHMPHINTIGLQSQT
jgi:hypothetical protein